MSASPAIPHFPSHQKSRRALRYAWIPVLIGLTVICCESTAFFGGNTTSKWLAAIWPRILGQANTPFFGEVHHTLRKIGHFTGYGTLGLLLRNAWHRSVQVYLNLIGGRLMLVASALAVSCTFFVGSLDEWHQSIVPGRVCTLTDVLIDTCGALLFNLAFWALLASRRSRALNAC
jgi:VanZ family protein